MAEIKNKSCIIDTVLFIKLNRMHAYVLSDFWNMQYFFFSNWFLRHPSPIPTLPVIVVTDYRQKRSRLHPAARSRLDGSRSPRIDQNQTNTFAAVADLRTLLSRLHARVCLPFFTRERTRWLPSIATKMKMFISLNTHFLNSFISIWNFMLITWRH